jgi:outer membrane immunogenic protein
MKKPHAALTGLAALTLFDLIGAQAQAQSPQNWAGYYVGVHAGYRWGEVTGNVPFAFPAVGGDSFDYARRPFTAHPSSGIVGFHGGYNYVSGNWLIGGETAWSWGRGKSNFSQSNSDIFDAFATLNYQLQLTWSGSVRARFGHVSNDWLFYGTAGFAFQHAKLSGTSQFGDSFAGDSVSVSGRVSQSKVLFGYIVGAGIERQIVGGWTWRAEYLFADYGRQNFGPVGFSQILVLGGETTTASDASQSASVKVQTHTVRVGITKLFQPW